MTKSTPCLVAADVLEAFMRDVFVRLGVPQADAQTCAEILIASDLRGIESHGIGRLKMYYDRIRAGLQQAVTTPEDLRQSPTTLVIDGHDGMGQVLAHRAMSIAMDKARQYGMGAVAVRNSSHFGIAGYYPMMAAAQGMIGLTVTNARPSIAPTFSVKPMLGTNPIAFACPTDEAFDFVFDAATSITQRGKLEVLARKQKPAPSGWVIDRQAHDLTDSAAILDGFAREEAALLPLGGLGEITAGYKGYGLATIVEILSASLQTGSFLYGLMGLDDQGNKRPNALGHFFLAMNVEAFAPLADFKRTTGDILRELRAATLQPGCQRIYTAGEKEYESTLRVREGGVAIVPNLLTDIHAIIDELDMADYRAVFSR